MKLDSVSIVIQSVVLLDIHRVFFSVLDIPQQVLSLHTGIHVLCVKVWGTPMFGISMVFCCKERTQTVIFFSMFLIR